MNADVLQSIVRHAARRMQLAASKDGWQAIDVDHPKYGSARQDVSGRLQRHLGDNFQKPFGVADADLAGEEFGEEVVAEIGEAAGFAHVGAHVIE